MDLLSNVTAACPSAFADSHGQLFAGAIAAVVAAHCAFSPDSSWPPDISEDIFNRHEGNSSLEIYIH